MLILLYTFIRQAWQWRVENPVAVPEPMEVQFDRYFRGASAATETSLEVIRNACIIEMYMYC